VLGILVVRRRGRLAPLVDGTLGVGFGVTSASVLLLLGVAPALAGAATHPAKLPTPRLTPAGDPGSPSASAPISTRPQCLRSRNSTG